eukprot:scaffold17329_cov63-Phaeocystis_antarctica.AAC.2
MGEHWIHVAKDTPQRVFVRWRKSCAGDVQCFASQLRYHNGIDAFDHYVLKEEHASLQREVDQVVCNINGCVTRRMVRNLALDACRVQVRCR